MKEPIPNSPNGFTLIELLVVIIILSIIASLSIPNLGNVLRQLKNRSEADRIASFLKYARYQAVVEGIEHEVVYHPEDTSFCLFKQKAEDKIMNSTISLPTKTRIESSVESIIFYPQGNSSGGKIRVNDYLVVIKKIPGSIKVRKSG